MAARVIIRPLREEDCAALPAACFPETPADDVAARLADELAAQAAGEGLTLVAEEGGRVGAAMTLQVRGGGAWVHNVAAHPDFRGRGIIQRMFKRLLKEARARGLTRLSLHVRRDNLPAVRAYERAGFRYAGEDGMRGEQLRYERRLRPASRGNVGS